MQPIGLKFAEGGAAAGGDDVELAAEAGAQGGEGGLDGFVAVTIAGQVGEVDVTPAGAGDGGEQVLAPFGIAKRSRCLARVSGSLL